MHCQMNMKQRTIRRLEQMIIIDAGVEREATAEEEVYIKKCISMMK